MLLLTTKPAKTNLIEIGFWSPKKGGPAHHPVRHERLSVKVLAKFEGFCLRKTSSRILVARRTPPIKNVEVFFLDKD